MLWTANGKMVNPLSYTVVLHYHSPV